MSVSRSTSSMPIAKPKGSASRSFAAARATSASRTRGRAPMIVLKLGGSLASSGGLTACLAALGTLRGEIVVVPGGGFFADAVRAAQPRFGFSDRAAHHMAILAMEQYALLLVDRLPRL